ncbi:MAG: hypothetical protein GF372_13420 [Candidatus Marinimicrobia bacterium]|nr:hypothetical protein [Candidatus Neomarinimicrobiota bacterium]
MGWIIDILKLIGNFILKIERLKITIEIGEPKSNEIDLDSTELRVQEILRITVANIGEKPVTVKGINFYIKFIESQFSVPVLKLESHSDFLAPDDLPKKIDHSEMVVQNYPVPQFNDKLIKIYRPTYVNEHAGQFYRKCIDSLSVQIHTTKKTHKKKFSNYLRKAIINRFRKLEKKGSSKELEN